MIRKLEVDNFKSLVGFSMELSPFTVVIGNNATGKSSILQAIDFLCNSAREDFSIIIERRNWRVENIKSKLVSPNNNRMMFRSCFSLGSGEKRNNICWELCIHAVVKKNMLILQSEEVRDEDTGEILLSYTAGKQGIVKLKEKGDPMIFSFELQSSVLKMVGESTNVDERVMKLKQFLLNSTSFELLSPLEMRLSSRGAAENIGMSGKNLPSFIKKMNGEQKARFMSKLQSVLGSKITEVAAQTKGKPGWTQIDIQENYESKSIRVNSKELSDGILRLLAFIAITEISCSEAVFLLDEIENGINTNYAEQLLDLLKQVYKQMGHQLVLTTHSTVFLDYVDRDSIVYLYRNEAGQTKAVPLFGTESMRKQLEYMWPGEVILNMSQREILDKLLAEKE